MTDDEAEFLRSLIPGVDACRMSWWRAWSHGADGGDWKLHRCTGKWGHRHECRCECGHTAHVRIALDERGEPVWELHSVDDCAELSVEARRTYALQVDEGYVEMFSFPGGRMGGYPVDPDLVEKYLLPGVRWPPTGPVCSPSR